MMNDDEYNSIHINQIIKSIYNTLNTMSGAKCFKTFYIS